MAGNDSLRPDQLREWSEIARGDQLRAARRDGRQDLIEEHTRTTRLAARRRAARSGGLRRAVNRRDGTDWLFTVMFGGLGATAGYAIGSIFAQDAPGIQALSLLTGGVMGGIFGHWVTRPRRK